MYERIILYRKQISSIFTIDFRTNNMLDWEDFDMHEDDEDYIESQKRKQQEEEQQRKLRY